MAEEKRNSNSELNQLGHSITRLVSSTVSAGLNLLNQVAQKAENAIVGSEITPLDNTTQELLARSESLRCFINALIDRIESFIEPDPLKKGATKLINIVDAPVKLSSSALQIKQIGECMTTHAHRLPPNSPLWNALTDCGTSLMENGLKHIELVSEIETKILNPLRSLIDIEYLIITKTKNRLMDIRPELDSLKHKQARNYEDASLKARCQKINSDFEMIKTELQCQINDFCGVQGQVMEQYTEFRIKFHRLFTT
ncbi:hypothetical protein HZS_2079 [Henneguya salminicola]|nr:hypothetical protein HZS_2079 [Henneguya salminicola]